MDTQKFKEKFMVFEHDGGMICLPDLVTVYLYSNSIPRTIELKPRKSFLQHFSDAEILRYPDGQSFISAEQGHMTVNQSIGHLEGLGKSHTRTLKLNLMRWLRSLLESSGLYDDSRCHRFSKVNFIRRSLVQTYTNEQLLEMALDELSERVKEQRLKLQDDLELMFGQKVHLDSIKATLADLEIAWDREHPLAHYIPQALGNNFEAYFGESAERAISESRTMLWANPKKGEVVKVYLKAVDVIRYEVKIGKPLLKKLSGCSVDPTDPVAVRTCFQRLAQQYYKNILAVQEGFSCVPNVSPIELVIACCPHHMRKKIYELMTLFSGQGFVVNEGGRYRRHLEALRKIGHVEHVGRGRWRLKPHVQTSMLRLGRYLPLLGDKWTVPPPPERKNSTIKRVRPTSCTPTGNRS